jgi:hypothetical protein
MTMLIALGMPVRQSAVEYYFSEMEKESEVIEGADEVVPGV